jgi:pimeloyl-ACP methyl ester carboxylesterase
MTSERWTAISCAWLILLSAGCASIPVSVVRTTGPDDPGVPVRGLVACGESGPGDLDLDPARPLVLFVPGRGDSGSRYRELAWRFEQQAEQTACFDPDDRESLQQASARLIRAIEMLKARLAPTRFVIIGHGIGGLIARRALIAERPDALRGGDGFTYTLVTVATPFGGVRASADCGRTWLHALTFGASALVCNLVAGPAWLELPPGSAFIRTPGTLLPEVEQEIEVVADERGACRQRVSWDGSCLESDSVFTVGEQRSPVVERDPQLRRFQVSAGHNEIVGDVGIPPTKLMAVLEAQGLLNPLLRVAGP